jgi:hypothetical protein
MLINLISGIEQISLRGSERIVCEREGAKSTAQGRRAAN